MAEPVDEDLASGVSYINSLIAGFFIIWLGTCMYNIESIFGFLGSPFSLLAVDCVLDFSSVRTWCDSY